MSSGQESEGDSKMMDALFDPELEGEQSMATGLPPPLLRAASLESVEGDGSGDVRPVLAGTSANAKAASLRLYSYYLPTFPLTYI